jgi:hypothetical protein
MGRLQSAKKVFFAINQELEKIERNAVSVNKLKVINEELADAVIELIKKYELCESTTNYATKQSSTLESTSGRTDQDVQNR